MTLAAIAYVLGWPDGQLIRLALTHLAEYMESGGGDDGYRCQ